MKYLRPGRIIARNSFYRNELSLLLALLLLGACGRPDPGEPLATEALSPYDADGASLAGPLSVPAHPNLLIVVVEQLRADALPPGALPGATALLHAVTPRPEPAAALASLLTGRLPSAHRVDHRDPVPRLEPGHVTLPEILSATAGYATRAFVAGERLARGSTLWQGAQVHPERVGLVEAPEALAAWTRSLPAGKPWCALLHADEALPPYGETNHVPRTLGDLFPMHLRGGAIDDLELYFTSRPGYAYLQDLRRRQGGAAALVELERSRLRWLWEPAVADGPSEQDELRAAAARWRGAYEQGTRWTRGLLQGLLEQVKSLPGSEGTIVLVTSTGGTAFLEHEILGPGRQLYDEQVHIPFLLLGPGPWAGQGAVAETASLVDVLPTLLDLLRLPPLPAADGRSLLPGLRGPPVGRPVISEEHQDGESTGSTDVRAVLVSVRSPRWKYVVRYDLRAGTVIEQAFDLAADPGELRDLAAGKGSVAGLPFDEATCAAIEHVRDGLWGRVEAGNRTGGEVYSMGAPVRGDRPPPCGR